MICIILTEGMETPLPYEAYYCDTGLPMLTYGEYYADINNCCADAIEPGIFGAENADEGVWLVLRKSPYTSVSEVTVAEGDTLWFDAQGRLVSQPQVSGIYFWKSGNATGKVIHVR